jgi:hypothetical protein
MTNEQELLLAAHAHSIRDRDKTVAAAISAALRIVRCYTTIERSHLMVNVAESGVRVFDPHGRRFAGQTLAAAVEAMSSSPEPKRKATL